MSIFHFAGHPEIPGVHIACDAFHFHAELLRSHTGAVGGASISYQTREGTAELDFVITPGALWSGEFDFWGTHIAEAALPSGVFDPHQAFNLLTGDPVQPPHLHQPSFDCHVHHHHAHHHDCWFL